MSMSTAQEADVIVRAAHILVPDDETADLAMERVTTGGESFQDVAKELSTCPSKEKGGDLGWFGRGAMTHEFDRACFSSEPGSLLKVRTKFGVHVIAVVARAPLPGQMAVQDLARIMGDEGQRGEFQYIDVREEPELEKASLPGFLNLPLSKFNEWGPQLTASSGEERANLEGDRLGLDPAKPTVVLCHMGMRSMQMAHFLCTQAAFQNVFNIEGGISAYANEVDPSVGRY